MNRRAATADDFDAHSLARRIFEVQVELDIREAQRLIGVARRAGVEAEVRRQLQRLFDVGAAWAIDRLSLERRRLRAELHRDADGVVACAPRANIRELRAQLLAHEQALDLLCERYDLDRDAFRVLAQSARFTCSSEEPDAEAERVKLAMLEEILSGGTYAGALH